ncbi:bifunctional glycerol-3-phosphate/glycerone-phosphate O-acyltransferase GPT2 [Lachancea thermotolerans CBS 6340]|uniref:KLTH0F17160p n=1 Tax=Lachancea thermotolerans (strain ATCC 56472 / CBS 6340 / NRRL Y-8284) TaxID=559295 RepID=C5DJK4_LACTC|nr:KLTH0F17160p [Lachancea thermotolerans CBS 6340]CAR24493.1 KLTH0F17160p [Lachancea thermotolerans CBS 6340]
MASHVPKSETFKNPYNGESYGLATWVYDLVVFVFNVCFTIFFREIKIRGTHNMPCKGTPTILVCAPHANQFVDGALVMSQVRNLRGSRSRQTCLVTAESSYKKRFISIFSRSTGGIPVPRAQDNLKPVDPALEIYVPDWAEPTVLKCRVVGRNESPRLSSRFTPKSLVGMPSFLGNAQIAEIPDDETLVLTKPFKDNSQVRDLLTKGTNFKYAPKIDNTSVFQNVFNHLHSNGCVGIFPEGGSHDRPSLLPIKAGVAIMALGAAAADPSSKIHVVPCGLSYFHRNKFRSRAVLEFGQPIIVDGEMGKRYEADPRGQTSELLDKITQALYAVTVNAPDYETLMTIQAARRLYQPAIAKTPDGNGHLPLPLVVEMNRRLLIGYSKYKDDPRIRHLKAMVLQYNSKLYALGLRDHQVPKLTSKGGEWISLLTICTRVIRICFYLLLSLPGTILFMPVFVTCHYYAQKKAEDGLKKSLVKIKGTDLLATWKLLVALVLAPTLYVTYSLMLCYLVKHYPQLFESLWVIGTRTNGYTSVNFVFFYALLVSATYASFKTGETGMDLFKSLPPLAVSLVYTKRQLEDLKETRKQLSLEVTQVCNDLGPTVFPDFGRFITTQKAAERGEEDKDYVPRSRSSSVHSMESQMSNALSKVNSNVSLSDIPILAEGSNEQQDTIEVEKTEKPSLIGNLVRQRRQQEKQD